MQLILGRGEKQDNGARQINCWQGHADKRCGVRRSALQTVLQTVLQWLAQRQCADLCIMQPLVWGCLPPGKLAFVFAASLLATIYDAPCDCFSVTVSNMSIPVRNRFVALAPL